MLSIGVFPAAYWLFGINANPPAGGWSRFTESLYFSIATISTTGYGDIVPTTATSRFIASVEVLSGLVVVVFALGWVLATAATLPTTWSERWEAFDPPKK